MEVLRYVVVHCSLAGQHMFSFAAQHIVKLSGDVLLAVFLHMSACCMRPAYGHFPSSDGVLVLRMCTHWGHSASYMQLHPRCKATAAVAIAALGECVGYFFFVWGAQDQQGMGLCVQQVPTCLTCRLRCCLQHLAKPSFSFGPNPRRWAHMQHGEVCMSLTITCVGIGVSHVYVYVAAWPLSLGRADGCGCVLGQQPCAVQVCGLTSRGHKVCICKSTFVAYAKCHHSHRRRCIRFATQWLVRFMVPWLLCDGLVWLCCKGICCL